jgi:hypothetical protein
MPSCFTPSSHCKNTADSHMSALSPVQITVFWGMMQCSMKIGSKQVDLQRRYTYIRSHDVTPEKTRFFLVSVFRGPNITCGRLFHLVIFEVLWALLKLWHYTLLYMTPCLLTSSYWHVGTACFLHILAQFHSCPALINNVTKHATNCIVCHAVCSCESIATS